MRCAADTGVIGRVGVDSFVSFTDISVGFDVGGIFALIWFFTSDGDLFLRSVMSVYQERLFSFAHRGLLVN